MTRTQATVKTRQERRRLEREAGKERLERQAEQDGCKEARQSTDNHIVGVEEDRAPILSFENTREERMGEEEGEDDEEEREEEVEGDKATENDGEEGQLLLTDYEKQRAQRIKENASKLASLKLSSLATSLRSSRQPQRLDSSVKRKKDDDYMPSSSSDSQDSADYNTHNEHDSSPQDQQDHNGDLDKDGALEQAIALSLAENVTDTRSRALRTRRSKSQPPDKKGSAKKRRKGVQEQLTAEEIAAIFAIFDEQGTGKFSVAELERIVHAHNFAWSKQEIIDMIEIFDSNKDGQLDLPEFQTIFGRMNMSRMHVI